jgi:ectoine hydroxylase-related dioxygenase (phytanoyl-CoA dioxygenase family)
MTSAATDQAAERAALSRRDEFLSRGFVVERNFFSAAEMERLCDELRQARPQQSGEDWLTKGNMVFRSNLYRASSFLQTFITQQRLVDLLAPIAGPDFWVRWDQAVNKLPGGGEFPWHQDNAYNRLLSEHYQLWIAATPIRRENGGLWLDPSSHLRGRLSHRFVERQATFTGEPAAPHCIEAEAGDVILFSSLLLHYTSPNVSAAERWAYVVEYVPLDDFDPYVPAPYFVAAREGRSAPGFVQLLPGRLRLRNRIRYLLPRTLSLSARAWSAARRALSLRS